MKNAQVVILAHIPWDWTTDYINQTARILSRGNTVIVFFWPGAKSVREHILSRTVPQVFTRKAANLYFFSGIHVLPFRRVSFVARANQLFNIWCIRLFLATHRTAGRGKRYLWFFDPRLYSLVPQFGNAFRSVYDCVDLWSGDPSLKSSEKKKVRELELESAKRASFAVVNSQVLYKRFRRTKTDLRLVPLGFRADDFMKYSGTTVSLPRDKPVIGYIGAINHRIDYRLLIRVAASLPQYLFVFAGPQLNPEGQSRFEKDTHTLFTMKNVKHIGEVPKHQIPGIIRQFSIGIIPYRQTRFNTYAFPTKVMEYLYMGKPVISTPIKELTRFGEYVYLATGHKQWTTHVRSLLSRPALGIADMRHIALANSWEKKISAISVILDAADPDGKI